MLGNFSQFLLYLIGDFLYLLSLIIPKAKKIWVFGSWAGNEFADNPKYIFLYLLHNHPDYKPIWLTKSRKVYEQMKSHGYPVCFSKSLKGFWYSCRASVGVTSHGMIDINRFACARLKIVQTWHGVPMKPILLSDPKKESKAKRKMLHLFSWFFWFLKKELEFNKNLLVCSSSDEVSKILRKCFGQKAPLINAGFPRLDGLFSPEVITEFSSKIIEHKKRGKRIGIYMPTYRVNGEYDIIKYFVNSKDAIRKALEDNNTLLYLRIHPFDEYKIDDLKFESSIQFISSEDINGDIYHILGHFDFIISDYSSIIFDFLILARPIFLLAPDRESYIESNGNFVYDYINLGLPVYSNWEELLNKLNIGFSESSMAYFDKLSAIMHDNRNGRSSERNVKYIIAAL